MAKKMVTRFILASGSAHRTAPMQEIVSALKKHRCVHLDETGSDFLQIPPTVDEKKVSAHIERTAHNIPKLGTYLAERKALDVLKGLPPAEKGFRDIVVACDFMVRFGNELREKPVDNDELFHFLVNAHLQPALTYACVHIVENRIHKPNKMLLKPDRKIIRFIDMARVDFTLIPQKTILEIVRQGNMMQSAGGFNIEDPLIAPYITHIDGERQSIIGLPVQRTVESILEIVCA